MIQLGLFLILILLIIVAFFWIFIIFIKYLINVIRSKRNPNLIKSFKKASFFLLIIVLGTLSLVLITQITTTTPKIEGENSISELTELNLNGRKQWISIRATDKSKPVLLFLAGGPGGTQMAAVRYELGELEKHFVVVNWDQPGSGKSYYAEKISQITVDTYLEDGFALIEYLKERFLQDKIYLIGESWGSALGIFLVAKYPDSIEALIGTGQMIDFLETEKLDYAKALEIAESKNDRNLIERLLANGEPPYYGKDVTWKSAVYLNYLSEYMASNPNIHNSGYNTIRDIAASEYGLLDKINYLRGVINTFNHVYQQLYEIDLRKDYPKLDVPIFFFLGKHDINAPTSLVEEYFNLLDAPEKRIIWFENSGHSPWINERDKFVDEVISCFLGD
jgi:pimeloyl-ACP methyl ester carboxylesterase